MTTLLVFGGASQLGREIAAQATESGISATILQRSEADITDGQVVADWIARSRPDVVVNAAAYTNVDQAQSHGERAFLVNGTAPGILADACARAKIPLVHVSTDYVFDGTKHVAYVEDDPIAPLNVYGQSKAAGESAIRKIHDRHLILRTSWLYSIHGSNFLKTILKRGREGAELRVVSDQRGCPTGAADLAEAILRVAPRLAAGEPVWGTYHFAGTGVTTWYGFATEIIAAQASSTGIRPKISAVSSAEYPTPAKRPANSELDSSLFAMTFGFRAKDWRERTREVVRTLLA
jgi:dTDP-4-dehydrorhamnose reductase